MSTEGLLVMGVLPDGKILIAVEDCKTVYDFGQDYGCLVGPRTQYLELCTPEELESSRQLEKQRIIDQNRKPVRRYYRRY